MAENEKKTAETTEEVKAEEKKTDKKPEKLDDKGLTAKGKENEAIEAALEAEEDDADDGDLILEDTRVSVDITADNTHFKRSPSGLVSLELTRPDGTVEEFERVVAVRCFPVTNPQEFVSVREPDSKKKGRGKEIGMIRRMADLPAEAQALLDACVHQMTK